MRLASRHAIIRQLQPAPTEAMRLAQNYEPSNAPRFGGFLGKVLNRRRGQTRQRVQTEISDYAKIYALIGLVALLFLVSEAFVRF